jgi:hypothetical protein
MSGVVTVSRALTPRNWTSTSDPTNGWDAADGVRVGDHWYNTATGNVWVCYDNTVGAAKWRHVPRVLGQSGTAATAPSNTTENILATVTVPANAMSLNGSLRVTHLWTLNNSVGNKTCLVKLGSTFFYGRVVASTTITIYDQVLISNRTTGTQVSNQSNGTFAISTAAVVTGSIDTTASQSLTLTGTKATAGDVITLESYCVELLRPDIT